MKNDVHKPVTMEDIENLLSLDEMKQFAAGAKKAFGPPAPASTVEFLRETSHEKEETKES